MPEIEHYAEQRAFRVQGPDAPSQNKSRPRLARPAELASERRALFVERPVRLRRDLLQLSFLRDLYFGRRRHLDQDAVGLFRICNRRRGPRVCPQDQAGPCRGQSQPRALKKPPTVCVKHGFILLSLQDRYSTARVSKRRTHRSAACLRARYCTGVQMLLGPIYSLFGMCMQRSIRSALLNTQLETAVEQFSHHTHPVA